MRSATGCGWAAASWGRRGSASVPRSTDGTIGSAYDLGVLDRERLNLELGVAARRRESPMRDVWVANYYSARNPLRLSSLVILGVVARMFRCATRSSCWCT